MEILIWQIWVCIVYKILYPSYIDRAIKRIGADYQNAQDCIENGDPNQIPAGYRKVFDKHTLKNRSKTVQEVIDSSLDEYVAVLQKDIQEAGINVTIIYFGEETGYTMYNGLKQFTINNKSTEELSSNVDNDKYIRLVINDDEVTYQVLSIYE